MFHLRKVLHTPHRLEFVVYKTRKRTWHHHENTLKCLLSFDFRCVTKSCTYALSSCYSSLHAVSWKTDFTDPTRHSLRYAIERPYLWQ